MRLILGSSLNKIKIYLSFDINQKAYLLLNTLIIIIFHNLNGKK
jgi:hypothetical protein